TNSSKKVALVRIGINSAAFPEMAKNFHATDTYHFYTFEEAAKRMEGLFSKYETIITSIHPKSVLAGGIFSSPGSLETWMNAVPLEIEHVGVLFGNPMLFQNLNAESNFDALVLAYENHPLAQEAASQLVFGALGTDTKTSFTISEFLQKDSGLSLKDAKRLKYSSPEEVGIDPKDLAKIDAIANKGLNAQAYPGCQILVAIEGKIIYRKNFGTVSYLDTTPVNNEHVYDIASISKIVGSTAGLMRLQTEGKFTLNKYIKDYIPELVGSSPVGNIYLKNMMAHQAGFTPWIAFYKSTVSKGKLDYTIYSEGKKAGFDTPVAADLWIRSDYEKTIYNSILRTPLAKNPKYEYSDLGYYFAKKIIEKESGYALDQFMYREYWEPMGLKNMRYLPLLYFPKERIVPTELDTAFRGRLVHGFVHDPGAAMLGGVGGHAGIFSNSTDLAAMMQLYLNKGFYANRRYISEEVIKEYTSMQIKGNRRGAGFDRPTNSRKDGPTCGLVSLESFGHSGFTGTFTWADPAYGINYVFLSNRVNPDASNKKIQEMHIRSDIQKAIYEAVFKAKKR
ncbi:MAG: serine hydrolase domain-containing protein, partial [Flavobacteriia bacterium]